jgi:hypothetical protein
MNLPVPEYGRNTDETISNLMDTVMRLRKELEYVLHHLGDNNIPELAGIKGDLSANYTMIEQTEEAITLLAEDVLGNTSAINVMSYEISLKVSTSNIINAINLSPEGITISANKINLNGVTTMTGLAQVDGTFRLGGPYDTWARMYIAGNNNITGQTGRIDILPDGGYDSGEIQLVAEFVRAYGHLSAGDITITGTLDVSSATVVGNFNVTAKFA